MWRSRSSAPSPRRCRTSPAHIEAATGTLADQREDIAALIVNAREATASLKTTLATANGSMAKIDRDVVDRLPALMDQLEATVGKLDSVAGNANAMIAENRPALQSFANEGLSQMGPTLAELRALIRDLRRVTDRLDGGPARYILGRDAPKEFEPK